MAAALASIFQNCDRGDGKIRETILRYVLQDLQPELWTDDTLDKLMNIVGVDSAGKVDYAKFCDWICGSKAAPVTKSKRKVAILGGAFDPPTVNHLLAASEVVHSLMADEVWLMPCGPRPDKPNLSPPLHRYVMCQLSVNTFFAPTMPIHVSNFEVMASEAFATYDSLAGLRAKYPNREFSFIIGTDWLQPGTDLRTWTSKHPETGEDICTGEQLVSEFDFLVVQRPGYVVEDLSVFGPRMKRLQMPEGTQLMQGNLSSTETRKRFDASWRAKRSPELIEGLVAKAVIDYILDNGLYQPPVPPADHVRPRLSDDYVDAARRKRVAVFGGAFDPPTNAHMLSVAEIIHSGMVDEAMLVPCGPRKDKPHLRQPLERYCMCELALCTTFSHVMPVRASSVEVFEKEALATYDSLCKLRDSEPDSDFVFVIGSDWLQPGADLRKWTSRDPQTGEEIVTGHKLVAEFDFIVIRRPGYDVEDIGSFGPRMTWVQMPDGMRSIEANLSSTEVRRRANISYEEKEGELELVDGLVPTGVFNFMKRHAIYDAV